MFGHHEGDCQAARVVSTALALRRQQVMRGHGDMRFDRNAKRTVLTDAGRGWFVACNEKGDGKQKPRSRVALARDIEAELFKSGFALGYSRACVTGQVTLRHIYDGASVHTCSPVVDRALVDSRNAKLVGSPACIWGG